MSVKIGDEVVSTKELFLSIRSKGRVLSCYEHYILVEFKTGVLDSGGDELLSNVWLSHGIEKIQKKEIIEVGDFVIFNPEYAIDPYASLYKGEALKVVQKKLTRALVETFDSSRFWCDIRSISLSCISLYKKQENKNA